MGKTYLEVSREIEQLKREAEALRDQERAAVVAHIREAITTYGFKPSDLFEQAVSAKKRAAQRRPIKFRDAQGNTWHGYGRRPDWIRDATRVGKSLDDFRV